MVITKYVMLILSPSVFDRIEWFMEVVGALSINRFNGSVVGSLVGLMDDVVWMIDGFVGDTEVESIGKIIGKLEGTDVAAGFNAVEGGVVVVGLFVGSIVESSLQVFSNVVDIAIGFSSIIL